MYFGLNEQSIYKKLLSNISRDITIGTDILNKLYILDNRQEGDNNLGFDWLVVLSIMSEL